MQRANPIPPEGGTPSEIIPPEGGTPSEIIPPEGGTPSAIERNSFMPSFVERYGPWALVTGASSGLGAEFARQLAVRGLNLVLVARRKDRLDQLAQQLSGQHHIQVKTVAADLSQMDFMSLVRPVTAEIKVGLLINNAGFALTGSVLSNPLEKELSQLNVNIRAPLILAHEFGREMLVRRRGGIIFLASIVGFMSAPFMTSYAATKAWHLFMGEGMWAELKRHGVDVLALCPGTTKTEFGQVAGTQMSGGMMPGPVVSLALEKLGKRPSVVAGWSNRALVLLEKFAPRRLRLLFWAKYFPRFAKIKV